MTSYVLHMLDFDILCLSDKISVGKLLLWEISFLSRVFSFIHLIIYLKFLITIASISNRMYSWMNIR